jgi:hypothetical protein
LSDIEQALLNIASVPRREGETAFPEIATIIAGIRGVIRGRRILEAEAEKRKRDEEYNARAKREMEEDKADPAAWQAQIAASAEKLGMGRKKVISAAHTELICPRCSFAHPVAGNIRFWTPEELRKHADTLEELALIAERNRTMPELPLSDAVEGVHES